MAVEKIEYLDGLRGLACLAVALHHCISAFKCGMLDDPNFHLIFNGFGFAYFFKQGSFQVCIFFIISGRVLTESFKKTGDFKKLAGAMIRRPFRLVLPIFAAMMISYVLNDYISYLDQVGYTKGSEGVCVWSGVVHPVHRTFNQVFTDSYLLLTLGYEQVPKRKPFFKLTIPSFLL